MKETWMAVVGYEGSYEISTLGRVKTLQRAANNLGRRGRLSVKERLLSPSGPRYQVVTLKRNGQAVTHAVHKLVLEAFVGPRPVGMQCRHFPNRDTTDNRLCNLRWGTAAENQHDRITHGTSNHGKTSPSKTADAVAAQIIKEYGPHRRYRRGLVSQRELAERCGVSLSTVNHIVRSKANYGK